MGKRGESVFLASGWHDAHVWSRHATKADHFAGKMSFKESELAKFKAVLRVHIPNDPNTLAKLKQDEALGGEFYRFEGEIPPEWIKLAYHVED